MAWLKDFFTRTKCPYCKQYINEEAQFGFNEYGYCDCDKCGKRFEDYFR